MYRSTRDLALALGCVLLGCCVECLARPLEFRLALGRDAAPVVVRVARSEPLAPATEGEPEPSTQAPQAQGRHESWDGDSAKFFTGALAGFLGHEAGHVIANTIEDTRFGLKSVRFGPIPFFTIEPGRELSPREHYVTASAGFNAQHLINEWVLHKYPDLKNRQEPLVKGLATFNFWLGVGYAGVGLLGAGPDERDTKGMADGLGWSEETVSGVILIPTLLDAYRYKHPDAKWAKDTSRAVKLAILLLALAADD